MYNIHIPKPFATIAFVVLNLLVAQNFTSTPVAEKDRPTEAVGDGFGEISAIQQGPSESNMVFAPGMTDASVGK